MELAILIVTGAILLIASYTDIKKFEVPDWLNYAGIAAGLGIHIIFAAQQWNMEPIYSSLLGLGAGIALGCLMFYTGQWGGGDAKLLMAVGALLGFELDKFSFSASYFINLVLMGGFWGVFWSGGLAALNPKKFWKTFTALRMHKQYKLLRITSMLVTVVFLIGAFIITDFKLHLLALAIVTYGLAYLAIFIRAVELSCMHKWVTPDKLTEGDWLVHSVKVGKTIIKPPKLGLMQKQVDFLQRAYRQKKLDKVLVKYGVPFVPAFLLAFILTVAFGNIILTTFF